MLALCGEGEREKGQLCGQANKTIAAGDYLISVAHNLDYTQSKQGVAYMG